MTTTRAGTTATGGWDDKDDESEKPEQHESQKPEQHESEKPEEHETDKPEEHKSEESEAPVAEVDKEAPEVEVVDEAAEEKELAYTGLNTGIALAAGLGPMLAGGSALYASRRRQYDN